MHIMSRAEVVYSGLEEHAWEVSNNEGLKWGSSGWKVFSMERAQKKVVMALKRTSRGS